MQITEVAILLEKKRKTNEDVKEEGRKRKGKWSGIMRKSEKNGNVGERKWRRKKGGGEIREIRGFKRGGPFQEILYFIYRGSRLFIFFDKNAFVRYVSKIVIEKENCENDEGGNFHE